MQKCDKKENWTLFCPTNFVRCVIHEANNSHLYRKWKSFKNGWYEIPLYILHKRKSILYVQRNQRRSLDDYFNISYQKEEVQVTLCNLHLASYSPFWHIILTQASVLLYLLNVLWSTSEILHKWGKVLKAHILSQHSTILHKCLKSFSFWILNVLTHVGKVRIELF